MFEDEDLLKRIWNDGSVCGTAIVYIANPIDHFSAQCDFEVTSKDSHPKEVRAYREGRLENGKSVKRLGDDRLQDELIVIFGAKMSANEAVVSLERLLADIKNSGLLIGRDEDDQHIFETTGRKPYSFTTSLG
jgi:hypothetical protein